MIHALTAAGIDRDAITQTPDGIVTVRASGDRFGDRFSVGHDGHDANGEWWTGTRYNADDEIEGTDSWRSLDAMATTVAAWYRPRAESVTGDEH